MMVPRQDVSLAPYCTLGVGGPARWFVEAEDDDGVRDAYRWARERQLPCLVLGGGSNLLVADDGVPALVVRIALRGVAIRERGQDAEVTAAAGERWDALVDWSVQRGLAGLECLSGIPGFVGATPIQNVGAYGQEVSETLVRVRAFDSRTDDIVTLGNAECAFAYRDSLFKRDAPGRWVVLGVTYRLVRDGAPAIRYADVERELAAQRITRPTLADVRSAVLAARRSKSMVIDPDDENRRSCGSFFTNPVVTAAELARVETLAGDPAMPRWPERDGRTKLSAAWLIEHAGFHRGQVDGAVGLSTRHALAIVAHDGARARDVLAFARRIQDAVAARFGVALSPEPAFWGFDPLPA